MPNMTMTTTTRNRGTCLPLRYCSVASGSQTTLTEASGYFRMAKEKMSMIARRYLVYDSKISVASVAIGLPLPISLANCVDRSLIKITVATKIMT